VAEQRLSNFSHPKISLGFEFLYVFTTLDFINCLNELAISNNKISLGVQIPPSVSTIILSGRTQGFVGLEGVSLLKLSDKILPGRSESLHSQIVKL
jgi:hypothetical protein